MNPFFTCQEATDRLTDLQEGALPLQVRLRLRVHLALCGACRAFYASLQSVGRLVRAAQPAVETAPDAAKAALAGALARLGQPRPRPAIPAPFAAELAAGTADPSLRLLAMAHRAAIEGTLPGAEPYLPAEVLKELPPPERWSWWSRGLGGARMARLLGPEGGHELYLLAMPGGLRFPSHRHTGPESLLVLQGGLEDGARHGDPGTWFHYDVDHPSHAPVSDEAGCWALVRVESGAVKLEGWRGWAQALMERL